jgi:hypothetical protein
MREQRQNEPTTNERVFEVVTKLAQSLLASGRNRSIVLPGILSL